MADRVPDVEVSDKDLALYRAIVGGRKPPGPVAPATLRLTLAPRLDAVVRLAQRRFSEGLRRIGFGP